MAQTWGWSRKRVQVKIGSVESGTASFCPVTVARSPLRCICAHGKNRLLCAEQSGWSTNVTDVVIELRLKHKQTWDLPFKHVYICATFCSRYNQFRPKSALLLWFNSPNDYAMTSGGKGLRVGSPVKYEDDTSEMNINWLQMCVSNHLGGFSETGVLNICTIIQIGLTVPLPRPEPLFETSCSLRDKHEWEHNLLQTQDLRMGIFLTIQQFSVP